MSTHAWKLADFSTRAPEGLKKKEIKKETKVLQARMTELQRQMNAEEKNSLLIVLQGMDAGGKDGATSAILEGMHTTAPLVKPFQKPTEREFAHDFLWRVHEVVPMKGRTTIFNRSHYEEVLIQRVHKWVSEDQIKQRFDHINNFERLLYQENNTTILKFYLHVSKEEQLERLDERKEILRKMHKHNDADWEERKYWDDYMKCYEDIFEHCGPEFPWIILPTDQNWYKEYFICKTVVETMEGWGMQYPGL